MRKRDVAGWRADSEFPELLSSGFIEDWTALPYHARTHQFPELLSSGFIEDCRCEDIDGVADAFPELLSSGFIEENKQLAQATAQGDVS